MTSLVVPTFNYGAPERTRTLWFLRSFKSSIYLAEIVERTYTTKPVCGLSFLSLTRRSVLTRRNAAERRGDSPLPSKGRVGLTAKAYITLT